MQMTYRSLAVMLQSPISILIMNPCINSRKQCGKNIADLPTPVTKQFVSMDDKSVEELDVKSILDLEIPPGKNVRTQKAMSSS